jgi:hypothetical protein
LVKATFIELPAFERHRADYLDDNGFRALQNLLMKHPDAGDPIPTPEGYANCGSEMYVVGKANAAACG